MDWIVHTTEGPDDMPAHIKTALTQSSIAIPVSGGRPVFGTWQGLYLFEHRARPHRREVVFHLIGDEADPSLAGYSWSSCQETLTLIAKPARRPRPAPACGGHVARGSRIM